MATTEFRVAAFVGALFGTVTICVAQQPPQAAVMANDNTRSSGRLAGGVLTVRLFAGRGLWRPEESDGPALDVAAFGEEGGPLLTPGPLVRVLGDTEIVVHLRNELKETLQVHGLVTHPASEDTVLSVPAGETREVHFSPGVPGTYWYWATTANSTLNNRKAFESQLGGAFIVDARDAATTDRVFVMTEWDDTRSGVDEIVTPEVRRVFVINGFSWPHTERLHERIGLPVRWRIVNLTQAGHPMHLHGFFFRVQAVGTGLRDTMHSPADAPTVVTQQMPVGSTMEMAWTPERPGNWLLHCHIEAHVTPALRFWKPQPAASGEHAGHTTHDPATAMAGLVMGIGVTGESTVPPALARASVGHQFTLVMRKYPGYWHPENAYGFSLESANPEPRPRGAAVPGPLLVLHRDEPVEITLKNKLPEATAIHWHGIELESYFDGVPGWSGSAVSTTPPIEPGGTFLVRFTPPRAGTFIYHTHSNDLRQLASGLYGAIVVLEPGERFDASRDHILLLGMEGPKDTQKYERFPVVINGSRNAQLTLKASVPNRLRLVNITTNFAGLNISLVGANQPVAWRAVAKDGAELPTNQQTVRPALAQQVSVGETFDFLVDPPQARTVWIEVRRASGEWVQQIPVRIVP